jgi:cytochrome c551/c552
MKKILSPALAVCLLFAFSSAALAGWNTCVACHNGTVAPNKEKILDKYKTIESFVKGAKEVQNPMMKSIQKDENSLKEAAKELGLK